MYHRSRTRFEDLTKDYNVSYKTAKRVFRSKLQIAMRARSRWPAYALHEEDKKFRAEHWNTHFNDKTRVVMHDNTNVPLPAPSDAALIEQHIRTTMENAAQREGLRCNFVVGSVHLSFVLEIFRTHRTLI
jgi:hypothetical protein